MKTLVLFLVGVSLSSWSDPALADYTLILKNGRHITVQSYREEGRMIKFYGLGGEIGISKDQVQAIRRAGEEQPGGLTVSGAEATSPVRAAPTPAQPQAAPQPAAGKPPSPEEEKATEETEYQQKLREVTDQLKDVRDRYSLSIRGTTSQDPTLLTNEDQLKARTDDVISRQKDERQNPSDPGVLRLQTPSPFSSLPPTTIELRAPTQVGPTFATPPPTYTERQKELSDLRNQAIELEKERERLINEMKQKNLSTGSLFLE